MKIKLTIEGYEPIIILQIVSQHGIVSTYRYGLFYPLRVLNKHIYNFKLKKRFSKISYPVKKCEGCGDGYIEWKIKWLNCGEKDYLLVCNHCVNLYDTKFTRKRLESEWELNAQRLDK